VPPTYHQLQVEGCTAQQQVLRLVQAAPRDHVHVVDLPYRLSSWAWSSPPQTRLWVTPDGELHAWACLQTPFWSLDFAVQPDAPPTLTGEVLSWADTQAHAVLSTGYGRPMWFAFAFSDQPQLIAALEAAGFESQAEGADAWSMVLMRHAPASLGPRAQLPPGFTLRPLRGQSEVGAYVDLHRRVFNSDSMTEGWRAAVLRQPAYDADLDLVVTDPDDELAAFCIGWVGPTGWDNQPSGQIEPLGVADRHRGQGLGRAIADECVRRLYAKGAHDVYVETDVDRDAALALYEVVGFAVERTILVFRKSYGPTAG
jgi:ribosomal protein S18 acetylase RimI-like enzyme